VTYAIASAAGKAERGDAYLQKRLRRVFDMDLRRITGLRDWTMAVSVVVLQQILNLGLGLEWQWFVALFVLAGSVLATWLWVVPRLKRRTALEVEQLLVVMAWITTGLLVYASGGPESPYIFYFALSMIFVTTFNGLGRWSIAQLTVGSLVALAPIAYDTDVAINGDFLATILVALVVWWAACIVVALKRRSVTVAELRARRLSLVDQLTGAGNLRAISEFAASQRGEYALAMVDLDGLGAINSNYGYFAGDALLQRAVDAMREASSPNDQVARVGGDEFVVLIPGCTENGAERWERRFRERLAILNATAAEGIELSGTVGVATTAHDGDVFEELLAAADGVISRQKLDDAPRIGGSATPSDRAQRLTSRMEADRAALPRWDLEQINLPTGPAFALLAATITGLLVGFSGGAESALLSIAILVGAYFAVFGSRFETYLGVGSTLIACAIAALSTGSLSQVAQTRILTIAVTVGVMAFTLQSNGRKLLEAEREAEALSLTDALTGLGNRRSLEADLAAVIEHETGNEAHHRDDLEGKPALIVVDLIDFKAANSSLGHVGGDVLLREVADSLVETVNGDGRAYRIGGDEFALILRSHHIQRVETLARRCVDAVAKIDDDGRYFKRGVVLDSSVGYALWESGISDTQLVESAVKSMGMGSGAREPGVRLLPLVS
jgi:diguanylate cyclase (GGDEF)-like protein